MYGLSMSSNFKVEYHQANDELKAIYDDILMTTTATTLPNWATYLGSNSPVLKGVWQMTRQIALQGKLSPLLLELIIFSISLKQGARYCAEYHAFSALRLEKNLSYTELLEIVQGNSRGFIPQKYSETLEIATRHACNSCMMSEADMAKLKALGYDNEAILEIIAICSLALTFNTVSKALHIPIDDSHRVEGFSLAY